jgi:hypothetical protein
MTGFKQISGWFTRFRNDLWRKRQGWGVMKDAQGVKWWVKR